MDERHKELNAEYGAALVQAQATEIMGITAQIETISRVVGTLEQINDTGIELDVGVALSGLYDALARLHRQLNAVRAAAKGGGA